MKARRDSLGFRRPGWLRSWLRGLSAFGSRFGCFFSLFRCLAAGCSLAVATVRGGPESQVVAKELHDKRAVAVRFLGKRIEFSNCVVKGLLGQMAGAIRRIQDLIVEYREIECKTQTNRVGWSKLGLSDIRSILPDVNDAQPLKSRDVPYLIRLVGSSCSDLTLLA